MQSRDAYREIIDEFADYLSLYGIQISRRSTYKATWPGSYDFLEETLLKLAGVTTKPAYCCFSREGEDNIKFTISGLPVEEEDNFAGFLRLCVYEQDDDDLAASVFVIPLQQLRDELLPAIKKYLIDSPLEVLRPYLCLDLLMKRLLQTFEHMNDIFYNLNVSPANKQLCDAYLALEKDAMATFNVFAVLENDLLEKDRPDKRWTNRLLTFMRDLNQDCEQFARQFNSNVHVADLCEEVTDYLDAVMILLQPVQPNKLIERPEKTRSNLPGLSAPPPSPRSDSSSSSEDEVKPLQP